ncbi:hypothetical protein GF395_01895 [Candidatus Uhrbacteria bacterium]|nr:hypothetical protein [Candidatus Uhrbacteria bacterium]
MSCAEDRGGEWSLWRTPFKRLGWQEALQILQVTLETCVSQEIAWYRARANSLQMILNLIAPER